MKKSFSLFSAVIAVVLLSLTAACGPATGGPNDGGKSGTTPTVLSNLPLSGATNVPRNGSVSATFSEPMDRASLNANTFTLKSAAGASVQGTLLYANSTATFWPATQLASSASYTATLTTDAKSASGVALAAKREWTFTTGTDVVADLAVNLGTAAEFAILAKAAVSTVPTSAVTGNIGVSPAAATYVTGFSLTADSTTAFSTSPQVVGKVYAADFASPTPSNMTTAIADMELAFTDAAGRAPGVTELGAGNIGGMTLAPGVYRWGTGVLIPTDLTLNGSGTSVWIFQIAQGLTVSSGTKIVLAGGALPKNIFWQVAGAVEVGTTAHLEGVVLSQTSITLRTGASIKGRMLAQTAVSIDGSSVVSP
jgi:hypothetical protein